MMKTSGRRRVSSSYMYYKHLQAIYIVYHHISSYIIINHHISSYIIIYHHIPIHFFRDEEWEQLQTGQAITCPKVCSPTWRINRSQQLCRCLGGCPAGVLVVLDFSIHAALPILGCWKFTILQIGCLAVYYSWLLVHYYFILSSIDFNIRKLCVHY